MKLVLKSLLVVTSAFTISVASHAVTASNTPWTVGINDVGNTANVSFNAFINGTVAPGVTASLSLLFTGVSADQKSWDFDLVALNNTSGPDPITSRVSMYGFNIFDDSPTAAFDDASASGDFRNIICDANPPQFQSNFSICFRAAAGQNCSGSGGGGAGLFPDDPAATGSFTLNFTGSVDTVTLNNFFTRYQSIDNVSGFANGNSAVGTGTSVLVFDPSGGVVPEPASWAMLIAGFGLVGATMRRRRTVRGITV